jgi:hypothetical protein
VEERRAHEHLYVISSDQKNVLLISSFPFVFRQRKIITSCKRSTKVLLRRLGEPTPGDQRKDVFLTPIPKPFAAPCLSKPAEKSFGSL